MTISKASRLIQELIDKYGNVEIGTIYDYWLTTCYKPDTDGREHFSQSEATIAILHLSDVIGAQIGWGELKNFEAICQGKHKPQSHPVEVQASKDLHDSPEQVALRKKHRTSFNQMTSYLLGGYVFEMQKFYDLQRTTAFIERTTPKEFGQALDSIGHRRK